jgi:hypothetical protein
MPSWLTEERSSCRVGPRFWAINSVGECYLHTVEVTSSNLVSPIHKLRSGLTYAQASFVVDVSPSISPTCAATLSAIRWHREIPHASGSLQPPDVSRNYVRALRALRCLPLPPLLFHITSTRPISPIQGVASSGFAHETATLPNNRKTACNDRPHAK